MADGQLKLKISLRQNYFVGIERLIRVSSELEDALLQATELSADLIHRQARENLYPHDKTLKTTRSVESGAERSFGGARGWVGTNEASARHLEFGTRPHVIRPNSKRAMHFFYQSREIFAQKVLHPGNPAYEWLIRAGESSEADVESIYNAEVERAIERVI